MEPVTESQLEPADPATWPRRWSFATPPGGPRRRTREVRVGDVGIGGANPIRIQSMTIADTLDTDAVVREIEQLHAAGSEIVRVTAPNRSAAENLSVIRAELARRGVRVPLVADIHFTPQAALIATESVEKVRINPGNYADRKHFEKWEYTDAEYSAELERLEAAFRPLVVKCKERGVAMRIGTNHGSLSDRILNRYGDTPRGMVESALEFVRICEHHGYRDLVLSMKASDVKVMVQAYRLLALRMQELGMDYPFHLGVTEAGAGLAARIKSAIGIGSLLRDGLGDTVRVSLTEDSVYELPVARAIAALAPTNGSVRRGPDGGAAATSWAPRIDPFRFQRRAVRAADPTGLGTHQAPRIEVIARPAPALRDDARLAVRALQGLAHRMKPDPDLIVIAFDPTADSALWKPVLEVWREALARPESRPGLACGIEVPSRWLAEAGFGAIAGAGWERVSVRIEASDVARFDAGGLAACCALQYVIAAESSEAAAEGTLQLIARLQSGAIPRGALGLDLGPSAVADYAPAWRQILAAAPAWDGPVVLRCTLADRTAVDAHASYDEIRVATAVGALLVDGIGDALQVECIDAARGAEWAAEVLQSTRARLSKADFIACPSCGRTQFDLQTTSRQITARMQHLVGLKIAVMGCVVNGPGEMADADFGYVGSGPGKIDLYVGHERVMRGVAQADAVERLIDLIRDRGRWVDPPAGPAAT